MTKQYMKFEDFKEQLFEAIGDEHSAWMGGIFWEVVTLSGKNNLFIYYAVLNNDETSIVNATRGMLEKECDKLCNAAGVSGTVSSRFTAVSEDYKHKSEYALYKGPLPLESPKDVEEMKKKISRELSVFLNDQRIYVGFEMTEKNTGLSEEIKDEATGTKAAIASLKKMAEDASSFGGWAKVKDNLKKMANMPAKDFFIEYGDNFLGALAFKTIASAVKLFTKKKEPATSGSGGGGSPTPSSGNPAPEWKDANPVETDMSVRTTESVNLNDYVNHADNANFSEHHYGSATVSIDSSNKLSVSGITMPMEFVVTVKLKDATTGTEIGEKEFKFNVT